VWMELLLKLVILCQYNSQIHRVPAGRKVKKQKKTCVLVNFGKDLFYFGRVKHIFLTYFYNKID
jgi:hypothetical protein